MIQHTETLWLINFDGEDNSSNKTKLIEEFIEIITNNSLNESIKSKLDHPTLSFSFVNVKTTKQLTILSIGSPEKFFGIST